MPELTYAYTLAAIATLCWGVVVVFIKLARTSGRLGIGVSMATGTIVMFALAGSDVGRLAQLTYPQLGLFFVTGTLQFTLGCVFYYESIRRGSLSIAIPITRLKVLPILFLSILLGLEVFRWTLLGACLLVVLGGILVGAPDRRASAADRREHRASIIFASAACICWALGETLIGKLPKDISAIASNAMLLGCGLLAYSLYALVSGAWRELLAMPGHDIWCYMAHGILSFSIAYALFVGAIQIAGPPRITVISSAYPLISALIGWSFYGERFSARIGLGALLLAGGVALLQFV